MEMDRLVVVLLTVAMLATESFAVNRLHIPFQSIKAPKETITRYERVKPFVAYRDSTKQVHPGELHIHIPTSNANYTLVLRLNNAILPSRFTSRHYDDQGEEVVVKGHVNCFYQGSVEGHPNWRVAVSLVMDCSSFGDMGDGDSFFHLEPMDSEDSSIEQVHALYLDSEYKLKQGSCGCGESYASTGHTTITTTTGHTTTVHGTDPGMDRPSQILQDINHTRIRRQTSPDQDLYIEWAVVNDFAQYEANGRNLSATVQRTIALANIADGIFAPLGIRIALTDVTTWTNGDIIEATSNAGTYLRNFGDAVQSIVPTSYDTAMLITGLRLNTLGTAYIGTMCAERSVSLMWDTGGSLEYTAGVVSHELGHVLNMFHDDDRQCSCPDGDGRCIMALVVQLPGPTMWSNCSINDLNNGFIERSTNRCLTNVPTFRVGDAVCGDGIREENETCDCGSVEECTNICCNAATCQLVSGAECADGPCCSNICQFISYGTECRAASGECDIAEYCPGDSAECPRDERRLFGVPCGGNTGYCYSGMCPTHNAQCQTAFGSSKGADSCYSEGNVRGDSGGSCGHTATDFIPCSTENVQCGQLQCAVGSLMLSGLQVVETTHNTSSANCSTYTTIPDSTMDIENAAGLVQDGTQCGQGMACLSQQCVPVTALSQSQECSLATNGQVCSGNGMCNERGTCSCDVGFTGADCDSLFGGPELEFEVSTSTSSTTTVTVNPPSTSIDSTELEAIATVNSAVSSTNVITVIGAISASVILLLLMAMLATCIFAILIFTRQRRHKQRSYSFSANAAYVRNAKQVHAVDHNMYSTSGAYATVGPPTLPARPPPRGNGVTQLITTESQSSEDDTIVLEMQGNIAYDPPNTASNSSPDTQEDSETDHQYDYIS